MQDVVMPVTERVRADLRAVADPERAPQMQAYMRSALPYLGVPVPEVRRITRAADRSDPPGSRAELDRRVRELWTGAQFREERYAATALLDTSAARRLRSAELMPLFRDLIVDGAWWDHVDELAHRVGDVLLLDRPPVAATLRDWATDEVLWLRRVAIIAQLGAKLETDTELLAYAIEANAGDREFFIRKAIGWALRDYARAAPDWVRTFVADHELSPLSRREALKHL